MIGASEAIGTIRGVVLAPLVGLYVLAVSFMLPFSVAMLFEKHADVEASVNALLTAPIVILLTPMMVVLVGSIFAYGGMIAIGLPTMALLRRVQAEGALSYAACGFVGGVLVSMGLRLAESDGVHYGIALDWRLDGYAGALTLFFFWRIGRRPFVARSRAFPLPIPAPRH